MQLDLGEAVLWMNRKLEVIQEINQIGLPLVLFGRAYPVKPDFLEDITVPVRYICDNNPATWGSYLWGLEIISPEMLQEVYGAYTVLILVPFEHEIVPQLQQLPVPPTEIFRLDLYFEEEGAASYFERMQPTLEDTHARLADQKSKDTYAAAIQYRIGRSAAHLRYIADPRSEQYFPSTLGGKAFLHTDEIFVDVGAFTGDTVRQFVSAVHGKYRAIYAFEPEPEAWEQLLKNVQEFPNVSCWQAGIGDALKTVGFSSGGSSSKVDEYGEQAIRIETLDHALAEVPITYLKMDIEGMERAALSGARQLIQKYHPKLAICTYHSNSDMVLIPKLIWEIDPNYQIYFRHYSHALVETICYAI